MLRLITLLSLLTGGSQAFVSPSRKALSSSLKAVTNDRRSFLTTAVATVLASPAATLAAQETEYRQGIEVNAFNGLIFNYKGGDFGGLDASTLNEPSIPYIEFCEKLKEGKVSFVEFLAPDGDAAYVTFKPNEGDSESPKPIRIGEGYPIEQHDGYSSPMFVVRTVKNFNIPYKFTVPGLAKYSS